MDGRCDTLQWITCVKVKDTVTVVGALKNQVAVLVPYARAAERKTMRLRIYISKGTAYVFFLFTRTWV